MTPPHIEKAALGLLVRSGHKKRAAQMERSTNSMDWQDAVADATLVWSLARAHTIEEAAKVACCEYGGFAIDTPFGEGYQRACTNIADAIRALAVEG